MCSLLVSLWVNLLRKGGELREKENIGTYMDSEGEEQVVLFDMMGTRQAVREKGPASVTEAMGDLARGVHGAE